jgi:hypothetical protein
MKIIRSFLPIRTTCGIFFVAGLFMIFLLVPASLAALERQKIHVQFSIEGQQFNDLPASGRERIEADVAKQFSTFAENQWGFIDWSPEPSTSADAIEWKITLRLKSTNLDSDGGGNSIGYSATLEHSCKLTGNGNSIRFSQTPDNKTIYALGSIIPFQNADDLGEDISRQLDRQLGDLLKSKGVEIFIQNVPIVEQLIAEETRIVVPVNFLDLRSENNSELKVKISGNHRSGSLKLETSKEVQEQGQYQGFVQARVIGILIDPLDDVLSPLWDPPPELTEAINSASEVKVYMITYKPSWAGNFATDGELILEPDL